MAVAACVGLAGCIPHGSPPSGYGQPPSPAPSYGTTGTPYPADNVIRTTDIPSSVKQPTPSWVARPVEADAVTIADSTYVVKDGETIRSIGNKTGAGSEAIARANNIPAPFMVRTGQRLKIPGGRYHLVRSGQSGIAIARAYGVSWSTIADLNDIQPPYVLRNGQRLLLPSAQAAAQMSPEERAQAFSLDIDDLATGSEPALASNAAPKPPTATPKKPLPKDEPVAEPSNFAGRFQWPLSGAIIGKFGPAGDGRRNDGINIAAERGEEIHAAADGVVAYAGSAIAVYGGLILIKHGDGWITAYGHAEQILVTRGQTVHRGDVIARAGATGSVNKPQLHFEIRNKRTPVDPLRYLPPSQN
ncbi:LysM peptidoglycan-binding domain-containing M23 family metallopeptidase [Sphingomonas sp. CGMCC 1.13654]|uniref:LysM peptidoglycan-binding domain-containing M23 family metallopeptidase n=2 Tax=Sphingomonas chungangi TaxID=2683589 RepID=A0A838L266_9SPHN|nr:LysM peptidoglycan-binding domain-containing M23 family metallopeptidase [Sphingomonas chungangi]MVW57954.1 peptidoglycan DD-metalloendopeptidase family protein [Sphingomonas chungangi]